MPLLKVIAAAVLLTASPGILAAQDSTEELEALYWARQKEAMSRYTPADVEFMVGMISHHAQALIMSRLAPENGASRAVEVLAARIINAQNDEISIMQTWLSDRGEAVPLVHIEGLNLMIHMKDGQASEHQGHQHGGHGAHHMPGMLTQAQLEELAAARGAAFDRLFLQYMIQHHKGAVTMVEDLFAQDGAAQDEAAYKLASSIHVDQITEIARMQQMLSDMDL